MIVPQIPKYLCSEVLIEACVGLPIIDKSVLV